MMEGEGQPPRTADDGEVSIRVHEGVYTIVVVHKGEHQVLHAAGYNTWRLFGMLSTMLGVRLSKKVAKAINLS